MSACNIALSGLDYACRDGIGGLKNIWLADWNAAAPEVDSETKRYSANIKTSGSPAQYIFKLYRIRTGNGSMNSTLNADESNGITYVTTDLYMKFTQFSETLRDEIAEILRGNVAAIVEDNKGNYWGLGAEHPLTLTSGTANTGAALSDFNGSELTLQDYSTTLPYLLDEDLIADLPTTVGA